MRSHWHRTLRAQLRDARVLLQESRSSLVLFLLVIVVGALVLRLLYLHPTTGEHPPMGEALYAALSLVFFNSVLPYPNEWYLQIIFFAIPILGLAAGADTVMFDPDLARRVQKGFGIQTAFSTSAIAAPIFAAAAMRVNVKHSFYLGDTLLNLGELVIGAQSQLVGWSVQRLEQELGLSVICSQSGECPDLHPRPGLQLCVGDRIIVIATLEALCRVHQLNGQ
jgi:hypothetical protein